MTTTQTLRTAGVSAARDYQELPAWQKSVTLAERIYGLPEDHAGLIAHMRNAALTVAASIAAASGRNNEFGMTDSYSKAQSTNAELTTQLTLAQRLGYIDQEIAAEIQTALDEVSRLIIGLKHGLKVAAKDAERAERDAKNAEREIRDERAAREDRPRREFKSRDGEDRPRREYKPRDGDDRPKREYKPRGDGEDRPRREFKPRDGDDRPRREFKPRDGDAPKREYKPRGEFKPRDGDDRPKREYKPRGEFKPRDGDDRPKREYKPRDDRGGSDFKPRGGFGGKPSGGKPFRKKRD